MRDSMDKLAELGYTEVETESVLRDELSRRTDMWGAYFSFIGSFNESGLSILIADRYCPKDLYEIRYPGGGTRHANALASTVVIDADQLAKCGLSGCGDGGGIRILTHPLHDLEGKPYASLCCVVFEDDWKNRHRTRSLRSIAASIDRFIARRVMPGTFELPIAVSAEFWAEEVAILIRLARATHSPIATVMLDVSIKQSEEGQARMVDKLEARSYLRYWIELHLSREQLFKVCMGRHRHSALVLLAAEMDDDGAESLCEELHRNFHERFGRSRGIRLLSARHGYAGGAELARRGTPGFLMDLSKDLTLRPISATNPGAAGSASFS